MVDKRFIPSRVFSANPKACHDATRDTHTHVRVCARSDTNTDTDTDVDAECRVWLLTLFRVASFRQIPSRVMTRLGIRTHACVCACAQTQTQTQTKTLMQSMGCGWQMLVLFPAASFWQTLSHIMTQLGIRTHVRVCSRAYRQRHRHRQRHRQRHRRRCRRRHGH